MDWARCPNCNAELTSRLRCAGCGLDLEEARRFVAEAGIEPATRADVEAWLSEPGDAGTNSDANAAAIEAMVNDMPAGLRGMGTDPGLPSQFADVVATMARDLRGQLGRREYRASRSAIRIIRVYLDEIERRVIERQEGEANGQ